MEGIRETVRKDGIFARKFTDWPRPGMNSYNPFS